MYSHSVGVVPLNVVATKEHYNNIFVSPLSLRNLLHVKITFLYNSVYYLLLVVDMVTGTVVVGAWVVISVVVGCLVVSEREI